MIKKVIVYFSITLFVSVLINPVFAFRGDSTDLAQKAKNHYTKGVIYGRQGMIDSALIHSPKAIALFNELSAKNSVSLAHAFQSLGIIYKISGKYDQAIECYDKAEHIYRANNQTGLLAYVYGNKANIYFIEQDYARARDFHLRAIAIFETDFKKYKNQISSSYSNLGNIYRMDNDFIRAINFYTKSLNLKDKPNFSFSTYGNLGICYEKINEIKKAEQYYLKAIRTLQNNFNDHNLWLAVHYGKYASFLLKQNRNDEAIVYFQKALAINRANFGEKNPETSESYNNIGHYYHQNNKLDKALRYYQKALISLAEDFNDTTISANPGIDQVLSKTHLLDVLKNKAIALSDFAQQNNETDAFNNSIKTFQLAIEVTKQIRSGYLSEQSKLQLVQNSQEIISEAIKASYKAYQLTRKNEYLEHAFLFSESGKSAVLLEAIKGNQALTIGNIPDSLKQKE
ncbi:MAG: tetratricopeptide repeat protein, partial [Bacteroidales bacterium]